MKDMKESDYELDMEIDADELDVECLNQPALMLKYSTKLAQALQVKDLAKEALDYMKAQIDKSIREDPEKYGLAKITETAVANAILEEKQYRDSVSKVTKASFEVNVVQGAVRAVEQRKQMLENLVKLHGQSYFAGPSVPHNLSELQEKRIKTQDKKIARTLNRTK